MTALLLTMNLSYAVKAEVHSSFLKTLKITYTFDIINKRFSSQRQWDEKQIWYIDFENDKWKREFVQLYKGDDPRYASSKLSQVWLWNGKGMYSFRPHEREALASDCECYDDNPAGNNVAERIYYDWTHRDQFGLTYTGQAVLLGKRCQVYEGVVQTGGNPERWRLWFWEGIVLKREKEMQHTTVIDEAIDIKENMPIQSKVFALPKDITFIPITDPRCINSPVLR